MHISIEFDVKFGSSFQRKFFLSCLKMALFSVTNFARGQHSKNKIYYDMYVDEFLSNKLRMDFEEQT